MITEIGAIQIQKLNKNHLDYLCKKEQETDEFTSFLIHDIKNDTEIYYIRKTKNIVGYIEIITGNASCLKLKDDEAEICCVIYSTYTERNVLCFEKNKWIHWMGECGSCRWNPVVCISDGFVITEYNDIWYKTDGYDNRVIR